MVEYNISEALESVNSAFSNCSIPWLIHAGFGMYLHGIEDADTHDIDIVLPTTPLDIARKALPSIFNTHIEKPGGEFEHGSYNSHCLKGSYKDVHIELIHEMETSSHGINVSSFFDEESLGRKKVINRYGIQLPLAPIEDIILYKLILRRGKADGKQDLFEISKALQQEIDLKYLRKKAKMVGAEELLINLDRYKLAEKQKV